MAVRTKAERKSSALVLFEHVWDHVQEATGHSWTRLNGAMCEAVQLAITAGLRFDEGDFERMQAYGNGRWIVGETEHWYAKAVEYGNTSACAAFEAWHGRKLMPNPETGGRLAVGDRFGWDGRRVQVTSFGWERDRSDQIIIACSYDYSGTSTKVVKRYRIKRSELVAANKVRKAAGTR